MDLHSRFSANAVSILLAFIIPIIIFSLFWRSRKSCKKTLPPEAAGAWPIIGHLPLLAGSQPTHKILGNLADKYGPIFTINLGVHRTLVVSSREIAKECLTTNDQAFASRPKALAMEILGFDYSMLGFSPYGDYWRQMRKIVTLELLSAHRLEKLKQVREAEVKMAIKELHQEWMNNNTSNNSNKLFTEMKKWFTDITLNVILKMIIGKRFVEYTNGCIRSQEEIGTWRDALREFMELSGKVSVSDALPYLRWLDLGGVEKEMKENVKKLDLVVKEWLKEHKQKKEAKEEGEDFMYALLSILDHSKDLSTRDADYINKSTCLSLVLAASDTTAITMTWALSLLLNNPQVLKKAQNELDHYVGQQRQVKESDFKNLVYLQAIIKETFRLYPAVPLSLPHESIEECIVNGYLIPPKTRLTVNVSKIQKDPSVWPNPEEFRPERFLTTHKDVDFKGQNFELLPFGSGRRMCPGITFALQVLNLTLATLLHSFEIETPSGNLVDMTETSALTNLKATPLEVFLTPRLAADLY